MAKPYRSLEVDYVCNPTSFFLTAKEDLVNRKIYVTFFVGEKQAFEWVLKGNLAHFGNKNELDRMVKNLVKQLMRRNPDEIQEQLPFLAYGIYERLAEVQTKAGKRVWRR